MEFSISDKKKKDIFISIFNLLKQSSSSLKLIVDKRAFKIQGMDNSHVCLFELILQSTWFDQYKVDDICDIAFDTGVFYSMVSAKCEDQQLTLRLEENNLAIEFTNTEKETSKKSDYNKFFTLPLIDYEYEHMNIPSTDYEAEFSIPSKRVTDMLSQLSNYGDDLHICCSQTCVDLKTKGDTGEMRVNIPIDDLTNYAIIEDEEVNLSYSLTYISKMCITNKISSEIEFSLNGESPMKILYNLQDENSLVFYIAPKVQL
jgi:proliferating cell nuclear antigen